MKGSLSQEKQAFTLTNSNAIISKPKNIFWISCCIFRIDIKLGILLKTDEPQRLFLSEIIESKMWVYLHA